MFKVTLHFFKLRRRSQASHPMLYISNLLLGTIFLLRMHSFGYRRMLPFSGPSHFPYGCCPASNNEIVCTYIRAPADGSTPALTSDFHLQLSFASSTIVDTSLY